MEKFISLKLPALFVSSLFMLWTLTGCESKKYAYTYLDSKAAEGKAVSIPFKGNDFWISLNLLMDTVMPDRKTPKPFYVNVKFSGQHQFWPEELRFDAWCNDAPVPFDQVKKKFAISSVINNKVSYLDAESEDLNIPALIEKVKKEQLIPDSVTYFNVVWGMNSQPVLQQENRERLHLKLVVHWKGGSEVVEKEYKLSKIDITKYPVRSRPFG